MTSQIVGQAVAPINQVLAGLQNEVAGIKCKLPETVTTPYSPFTAVFYGSSITEEKQMAQFIKDYVDDEDQQDGFIFNRFYADTSFNGVGIPWEEIL